MTRALIAAAALLVGCQAEPRLATTSAALFEVVPADHDFGDIPVGGGSPDHTVIVSTTADVGENVESLAYDCPGFVVDDSAITLPFLVEAGAPLTFPVRFAPVVPGLQSCVITITGPETQVVVTLTGNGLALPVDLTLVTPSDGALDFGDIPVITTSGQLTITVRNDGTGAVDVSPSITTGAPFALTDTSAGTLAPGEEHSWFVTCAPTADGAAADSFALASDDPIAVSLACNGITTSLLVTPSPLQFGELLVGDSDALDLMITNGRGAEVVLDGITSDQPAFTVDPPAQAVLGSGATTTATVHFTPTVGGNITGTLTIRYDGGAATRQVAVSGDARTARLVIAPSGVVDLGAVCVGDVSNAVSVTIGNGGTGGFDVLSIPATIGGFHTDAVPGTLDPGDDSTFAITFGPVTSEGAQDETLAITTSIPDDELHQIPLHAESIASGVAASPAAQDFGLVTVGETSPERAIRITNCDLSDLTVSAVTLVGDDAAAFELVAGTPTSGVVIATTDSASWAVEFAPGVDGPHQATLRIIHDRGMLDVALTGTGVGVDAPGEDRGSYLACRAGGRDGGGGLWPLVLALGVLLARRRRI